MDVLYLTETQKLCNISIYRELIKRPNLTSTDYACLNMLNILLITTVEQAYVGINYATTLAQS